jgi:hypothetical protein
MDWYDALMIQVARRCEQALTEAKREVIKSITDRAKKGQSSEGDYSDYRRSQRKRRSDAGLQTSYKDLHFSGTMFSSLQETSRVYQVIDGVAALSMVEINFTGQAYRRADQQPHHKHEPVSNLDIATWTGEKENKQVLRLAPNEKKRIEAKYNIIIHD